MEPMHLSNASAKFDNPKSYKMIAATLYFEPTTLSLNLRFLSEPPAPMAAGNTRIASLTHRSMWSRLQSGLKNHSNAVSASLPVFRVKP
jgi:hypothetical protein